MADPVDRVFIFGVNIHQELCTIFRGTVTQPSLTQCARWSPTVSGSAYLNPQLKVSFFTSCLSIALSLLLLKTPRLFSSTTQRKMIPTRAVLASLLYGSAVLAAATISSRSDDVVSLDLGANSDSVAGAAYCMRTASYLFWLH